MTIDETTGTSAEAVTENEAVEAAENTPATDFLVEAGVEDEEEEEEDTQPE